MPSFWFIILFVTIYKVPAALLVGFWFLIQIFSEAGSLVERQTGGIAYMAHIGGFVFGMVVAYFFAFRKRLGLR
jgi:membrane associated rhomboid family serine protease